MIPEAGRIVEGYARFLARRHKVSPDSYDLAHVEAAVREARTLATDEASEPAALFYALAKRPDAFPEGWRMTAAAMALSHAAEIRRPLRTSAGALDTLAAKVADREAGWDDVRRLFERMSGGI